MKIEDYIIEYASAKDVLIKRVMEHIQNGYIPQGGITFANEYFYQSMIKYEKEVISG